MPNINAESGKNYERRVIHALNEFCPDFRAFKQPQPSWQDRGDIRFSTVVLQAKTSTTGTKTMLSYLDDVEAQASQHFDAEYLTPAVIIRTAADVHDDLVLLRAQAFLDLVAERDRLDADHHDRLES